MALPNGSQAASAVTPIRTALILEGSGSRDWSIRPRKNCLEPCGRRRAIRFPLKLRVRYQDGGESGWGETVNIGSRGVLFKTDRALVLDARVEVYIQWPVLLDSSVRLSLIVWGTVIRVEPGRAALAMERHEFRTCARSFFQRSQPLEFPGVSPAQQVPSASTWRQGRPRSLAAVGDATNKNGQQRKDELNDARWERVFQEKFADPKYYSSRRLSQASPKVGP
jgi:PilZ domain-containing protein